MIKLPYILILNWGLVEPHIIKYCEDWKDVVETARNQQFREGRDQFIVINLDTNEVDSFINPYHMDEGD